MSKNQGKLQQQGGVVGGKRDGDQGYKGQKQFQEGSMNIQGGNVKTKDKEWGKEDNYVGGKQQFQNGGVKQNQFGQSSTVQNVNNNSSYNSSQVKSVSNSVQSSDNQQYQVPNKVYQNYSQPQQTYKKKQVYQGVQQQNNYQGKQNISSQFQQQDQDQDQDSKFLQQQQQNVQKRYSKQFLLESFRVNEKFKQKLSSLFKQSGGEPFWCDSPQFPVNQAGKDHYQQGLGTQDIFYFHRQHQEKVSTQGFQDQQKHQEKPEQKPLAVVEKVIPQMQVFEGGGRGKKIERNVLSREEFTQQEETRQQQLQQQAKLRAEQSHTRQEYFEEVEPDWEDDQDNQALFLELDQGKQNNFRNKLDQLRSTIDTEQFRLSKIKKQNLEYRIISDLLEENLIEVNIKKEDDAEDWEQELESFPQEKGQNEKKKGEGQYQQQQKEEERELESASELSGEEYNDQETDSYQNPNQNQFQNQIFNQFQPQSLKGLFGGQQDEDDSEAVAREQEREIEEQRRAAEVALESLEKENRVKLEQFTEKCQENLEKELKAYVIEKALQEKVKKQNFFLTYCEIYLIIPTSNIWFYLDCSNNAQGYYSSTQMQSWMNENYFRDDLLLSNIQIQQHLVGQNPYQLFSLHKEQLNEALNKINKNEVSAHLEKLKTQQILQINRFKKDLEESLAEEKKKFSALIKKNQVMTLEELENQENFNSSENKQPQILTLDQIEAQMQTVNPPTIPQNFPNFQVPINPLFNPFQYPIPNNMVFPLNPYNQFETVQIPNQYPLQNQINPKQRKFNETTNYANPKRYNQTQMQTNYIPNHLNNNNQNRNNQNYQNNQNNQNSANYIQPPRKNSNMSNGNKEKTPYIKDTLENNNKIKVGQFDKVPQNGNLDTPKLDDEKNFPSLN